MVVLLARLLALTALSAMFSSAQDVFTRGIESRSREVVIPVIAVPVTSVNSPEPHVLPEPKRRCRNVVHQILSHNVNKSRETLTNQFHKQTRDVDYYYRGVAYICEFLRLRRVRARVCVVLCCVVL